MIKNRLYLYAKLIRIDRPAAIFLLAFPALWIISFNTRPMINSGDSVWYIIYLYFIFLVGSFAARSVGCVINDIFDRNIDSLVSRTANRPLANKSIRLLEAIVIFVLLGVVALFILNTLNQAAFYTGIIGGAMILLYPIMKRITYYPQVFLGFTYSFGALVAEAQINVIDHITIIIYLVSVVWVIAYDIIYAMQDYEDDVKHGVKSMTTLFKAKVKNVVALLFLIMMLLLLCLGWVINARWGYYVIVFVIFLHLLWQLIVFNFQNKETNLFVFKSNIYVGWMIWLALLLPYGP